MLCVAQSQDTFVRVIECVMHGLDSLGGVDPYTPYGPVLENHFALPLFTHARSEAVERLEQRVATLEQWYYICVYSIYIYIISM